MERCKCVVWYSNERKPYLFLFKDKEAVQFITDRPVFAGMLGPFSLAARLLDVTEIMIDCYDDPDTVHTVLKKATEFLDKQLSKK